MGANTEAVKAFAGQSMPSQRRIVVQLIRAWLSAFTGWASDRWLGVITLGRWKLLGEYLQTIVQDAEENEEEFLEARVRLDRTEWRLNEMMRFLEQSHNLEMPGNIEPPRLTTQLEGEIEDAYSGTQAGVAQIPEPPSSP